MEEVFKYVIGLRGGSYDPGRFHSLGCVYWYQILESAEKRLVGGCRIRGLVYRDSTAYQQSGILP